ncbi:Prephenate dehydrogenase [Thermosinus carboxydivorans Nor1]|uniref:Prephenate dehydrogenase n=1 Tax=Thermosinus carboxydivorans Nor1 TaxID=401526 RepID=A1HS59_9FIRM|nr:prephenate dehydrogenase [Thermosinus carboxydivorans]EAX47124.1 Prephenate dehydrogenase [Thermosinus carboxydivorans Nor1]
MNGRLVVAVVGLGLIGGSLALALKKYTNHSVCGCDISADTLKQALQAGAVDRAETKIHEAVNGADVVIFCLPVSHIPAAIAEAAPYFKPGAVITDVASAKGCLLATVPGLMPREVTYIGGHPMAGSEKSGFTAAHAELFVGRPYILTQPEKASDEAMARLRQIITAIGAIPVVMDGELHDMVVAQISHIPHIMAAALVNLAGSGKHSHLSLSLAAGGFRDMTRIAASNPALWVDICFSNRTQIINSLKQLQEVLQRVTQNLEENDVSGLAAFLSQAREMREALVHSKYQPVKMADE